MARVSDEGPVAGDLGNSLERGVTGPRRRGVTYGWLSGWDVRTLEKRVEVDTGNGRGCVVEAYESVWVANRASGTVARVDPASGEVLAVIPVGKGPVDLVAGHGSLWVASRDSAVVRVNPTINQALVAIEVSGRPLAVSVTTDRVWTVSSNGLLSCIDPVTDSVVAEARTRRRARAMACTSDVWVYSARGKVTRIAPTAVKPSAEVAVGAVGVDMAGTGDALWAVRGPSWPSRHGELARLDPSSGQVLRRVRVPAIPRALCAHGDTVLIATMKPAAIFRLSVAGELEQWFSPAWPADSLALHEDTLWLAMNLRPTTVDGGRGGELFGMDFGVGDGGGGGGGGGHGGGH